MEAEVSPLLQVPFAHRGLHDDHRPENSMGAYAAAVERGYGIELDVQPSRDGEIVVFHDYELDRMTGRTSFVRDLALDELTQLRLLASDEGIPHLADVLALIDGRVPLLIEIKSEGEAGEFEESLAECLSSYEGWFAVQSFNPLVVHWFSESRPDFTRGLISSSFTHPDQKVDEGTRALLTNLDVMKSTSPEFLSHDARDLPDPTITGLVAELDIPLLAWTVRSQEQLEHLKHEGVANVIFEGFGP